MLVMQQDNLLDINKIKKGEVNNGTLCTNNRWSGCSVY